MQIEFWYYFFTQCESLGEKSKIVKSLEAHGSFSTKPLDLDRPLGTGVLFFDEFGQQICDFLREVSHNGRERVLAIPVPSCILTGEYIWTLLHAGASDVISWNGSSEPVEVWEKLKRWSDVDELIESPVVRNNLVGQSAIWKSVLREIVEVARFTDASVLIMGESGTGKELAARLIHTLDSRPDKGNLVVLDCTTIIPELSGSEFFGHERGAFTSAVASRDGAFALANGGTLFLDEVGELPPKLQAQLLRVVQEHTYKRVGGNKWHQTDFRLVCASNRDLLQEVKLGKFHHDLYYRIAGWVCNLPPLRERPEDILPLAYHFIRKLWPDKEPKELDESVSDYLLNREYPGNVRDLEQLISRISYFHVGPGPITVGDIPKEERPSMGLAKVEWRDEHFERSISRALSLGMGLKDIGRLAEDTAIRIAVYEQDTLKNAAIKLRVTERALQMRRAAARQRREEAQSVAYLSERLAKERQ